MEREAASSVVKRRLGRRLSGVVLLLVPLAIPLVRAQSEPKLIQPLKFNTVRIEATWPTGNAQYGFGIIVGERASTQLYIATANHVVRDGERGKSTSVKVWLRGEGASTLAELLDDSSQALDLAVLRVVKPQGFTWKTDVIGSAAEQQARATAVWFIGRDRDWFTPVTPGRISMVTFESKLQLEGMQVRVGSSGAPLVADSGIIGMLTSDEGDTSYGIPIEKIQQAFAQWSFPFTLVPAVSTSTAPAPAPPAPAPQPVPSPQAEPAPPPSRRSSPVLEPAPEARARGGRTADPAPRGRGRMVSNQKILNANSGLCLSPAGGSTALNAEIVQFPCDDDPSRLWNFSTVSGDDIVQIINNSGLCLTVAGGGTAQNTTAVQYTCDRDPSRRWRITIGNDQTFQLVNMNSNLCLTIAGGGIGRNTPAVQYPCDGHRSRDWQLRPR
jgi:hypothetical protein